MRVDGGSEYKDLVKAELDKLGIQQHTTNPDRPHENGVAERYNRSLFEAVRAIISSQKLHKELWGDGALYVCDILIKLPTRAPIFCPTPYESYYGKKPDLHNVRVFGCSVYSKIHNSHIPKLDDRSWVGIFIGFSQGVKGWKILNTQTKRTTTSKDCIFIESPEYIPKDDMRKYLIDTPWIHGDGEEEGIEDDQNAFECQQLEDGADSSNEKEPDSLEILETQNNDSHREKHKQKNDGTTS
jgi:hypothetical protein